MNVDPGELKAVQKVLWPDEDVVGTIKQRRIGPGGSVATPTTVVITNKRIIIINRASLGIRQDYEVIPYTAIVSVRLEHGLISSTVFIRVQCYENDKGLLAGGKQEGEIDGLRNKDAIDFSNFVNKMLEARLDVQSDIEKQVDAHIDSPPGSYVYCSSCGAKNVAASKFCSKCGATLQK